MSAVPLTAAALCAAFSGFTALSLAMDRHHEDTFGRGTSAGAKTPWLRFGGTLALLLSLVACLALRGASQGWVLWCGVLTASALILVVLLSYAPKRMPQAGMVAAAAMLMAGLVSLLGR